MTHKKESSRKPDTERQLIHRRLLLIDDLAEAYKDGFVELKTHGYETLIEINPNKAFDSIRAQDPDVVLLDLHFPGDDLNANGLTTGAKLLSKIQTEFPHLPVVVFTDKTTDDRVPLNLNPQHYYAKEMMQQDIESGEDWAANLANELNLAIAHINLVQKSPEELYKEMRFIVGKSPHMMKLVDNIRFSAGNAETVLIEGETGTGKDLVAKAIHRLSRRMAFIVVNCSGVHEETLESNLFGHEKGAFTGAINSRKGLFEVAAGGTLFLDEIQGMPLSLQNKLMRVVEDKRIQRMGGSSVIPLDVKIIAATNKLAKELVVEGKLREDLNYRLQRIVITVPPLRDRIEDIESLWPALVARAIKATQKRVLPTLRNEVRVLLKNHHWPGNVRELENVIFNAVSRAPGIIRSQDIVFKSDNIVAKVSNSNQKNTTSQSQYQPTAEPQLASGQTVDIFNLINQLPPGQRYDYLIANTFGDTRKELLTEISRKFKGDHPREKLSSKKLTEYLCGYGNEETFKKNDAKLRAMLTKLKLRISNLNQ